MRAAATRVASRHIAINWGLLRRLPLVAIAGVAALLLVIVDVQSSTEPPPPSGGVSRLLYLDHQELGYSHHSKWEDVFVAFDGMEFANQFHDHDHDGSLNACRPSLPVRSPAKRGGKQRGVDDPSADLDHLGWSSSLSTAECAQECFLRGRNQCFGFALVYEARPHVRVLSRQEQDKLRWGACQLHVDNQEACRRLVPTTRSFPLPSAFLWRDDAARAVAAGSIVSRGLAPRLAPSRESLMSVARKVTFLLLSSPENLEERMRGAWRTWLSEADNVAVFVEKTRAAGEGSFVTMSRVASFVKSRLKFRSAQLRQSGLELYVALSEPTDARVRHINGAWKPLAILQFLFAAFHDGMLAAPLAATEWFVLADDDTYIVTHNLYIHLQARSNSRGKRRASEVNDQQAPVMIGERFSFASMGHKVEYFQGGAGVVMSQRALYDPHLRDMFRASTGDDGANNCSIAEFVLVRHSQSYDKEADALGSLWWQQLSLTAACHADETVKEASRLWPAGDMRLAWVVREAQRRGEGWRMEHNPCFWHRSAQLALGLDRRGERSAFPISFHRARDSQQMDELHNAVVKALDLQRRFLWPELDGLVLRWSSLESFFQDAFAADSDPFLEDDGWI